jgi:hypothetical protein
VHLNSEQQRGRSRLTGSTGPTVPPDMPQPHHQQANVNNHDRLEPVGAGLRRKPVAAAV